MNQNQETTVEFIVGPKSFTLDVENGGGGCHRVADNILDVMDKFVTRVTERETDIEVGNGKGDPDIYLAGKH